MTPWDYSGNAAKEIVWDETAGELPQVNASKATQAMGEFPIQARVVMLEHRRIPFSCVFVYELEQLYMSYSDYLPSPRITVRFNQLFGLIQSQSPFALKN